MKFQWKQYLIIFQLTERNKRKPFGGSCELGWPKVVHFTIFGFLDFSGFHSQILRWFLILQILRMVASFVSDSDDGHPQMNQIKVRAKCFCESLNSLSENIFHSSSCSSCYFVVNRTAKLTAIFRLCNQCFLYDFHIEFRKASRYRRFSCQWHR